MSQLVKIPSQMPEILNYVAATDELAIAGVLSAGQMRLLKENGFASIIDVRTPPEGVALEQEEAEGMGMSYANIPLTPQGVSDGQLAHFEEVFSDLPKPIFLHCAIGARAAMIWVFHLVYNGMDIEEAIAKGQPLGLNPMLERVVRSSLS